MASAAVMGSRAPRAAQRSFRLTTQSTRGLAAAASGSFQYETGNAGVQYASRDLPGVTTTLAVVAKAGSRYQHLPGYSDALKTFAFKNTQKRSALRITREVELLGGQVNAYHTRENLVLQAKFLKDDLPYFAELLAEVISKTRYTTHELAEEVSQTMHLEQKHLLASPLYLALNSVHGVAFHRGLGEPLIPTSSVPFKYIDAPGIADFADAAYAKSNVAVVANGAKHSEVGKWVKEFFSETSSGGQVKIEAQASKYYGGEERIAHGSGNALVLGFPGSAAFTASSYKPEVAVLAALLGGQSSIKWSPGFSLLSKAADATPSAQVNTTNAAYSDAGLLYVTLTGKASDIAIASKSVVEIIKKVASGDVSEETFKKAVSAARFSALEAGEQTNAGIEATGNGLITGGKAFQIDELAKGFDGVGKDKVTQAAKAILEAKASVSAVGDLYALPFAEEIGLKV